MAKPGIAGAHGGGRWVWRLLVIYGLLNAVLYSVLMPLWEGFDEPFHFGYAQHLANWQGLPDPLLSRLSGEIGTSLRLAPVSPVVRQNLPQLISYGEFFSWPGAVKSEAAWKLRAIPVELRWGPSSFLNYEAHHPPLAYALLAFPERLMAHVPLPARVAFLRMMAATAGVLLLLVGADRLLLQLAVGEPYRSAALFCLLSSQMLWATLAHVGNDWLAIPLAVWTITALNALGCNPGRRTSLIAAALLAAGLLTKAYFLAFIPLLLGLCLWRRLWMELAIASGVLFFSAGPWYARNLLRYGVLTGTQEARAGIGLPEVLSAAPHLDWPSIIWTSLKSALWTGNNSFSSFSASTLTLVIAAIVAALLLWAVNRHSRAEWITAASCALFIIALGYAAVASHVYTNGAANGPSPWYSQAILAPVLGLAWLGLFRKPKAGRLVSATLVLLFGYLLAVTYAVKLIPLYGGYNGRTSLAAIIRLYQGQIRNLAANLDAVALTPAAAILPLAAVVIVLAAVQQGILIRCMFAAPESAPPRGPRFNWAAKPPSRSCPVSSETWHNPSAPRPKPSDA